MIEIKELTHKFLQLEPESVFIFIKKGTLIYDLEYLLIYEMNMHYWNDNDPFQETKYCIGDVAKYDMYYHIFSRLIDEKWYKVIEEDFSKLEMNQFTKKIIIDGNVILRYFKLKELDLG
jgi:hypothetical protein